MNVPVAVNCSDVPRGIEGIAGVTAIETRVAAVMVRFVDPAIDPDVAVMLVLPSPTLDATPAALTVATEWFPWSRLPRLSDPACCRQSRCRSLSAFVWFPGQTKDSPG